jgi:hypothetical protein
MSASMIEDVRMLIGVELSDQDATALAAAYASLARAVAAFPGDDLRTVEPPLHSIPGPAQPKSDPAR